MIEVTLGEEKKEKGYPKLMQENDGLIVLFKTKRIGAVVDGGNSDWDIGDYSETWHMVSFSDYDSTLTLKNGG